MNDSMKIQPHRAYDNFLSIFFYFFSFWFPWQPVKMSKRLLMENFCKVLSHICNGLVVNANFSDYKFMENLSCHGKQTIDIISKNNKNR